MREYQDDESQTPILPRSQRACSSDGMRAPAPIRHAMVSH